MTSRLRLDGQPRAQRYLGPLLHEGGHGYRLTQIVRRLGYNVNLTARGLRLSRSGLAGMALPHYRKPLLRGPRGSLQAEVRRRDLCPIVVVSTQRDDAVQSNVTRTLLAQCVEFLFIAGGPRPPSRSIGSARL